MKNYIILLFTLLAGILPMSAQEDTVSLQQDDIVKEVRKLYDEMDKTSMQTNYLFNRGLVVLNELEDMTEGMPLTKRFQQWKYLYQALPYCDVMSNTTLPNVASLDSINKIKRFGVSTIGLAIINYKGDYITHDNVQAVVNDGALPEFEPMNLFSGTVMHHYSANKEVVFHWKPEYYFTNKNGTDNLFVNFEDGQGYRELSQDHEQYFSIFYDGIGEKSIRFKRIDENGKEQISFSIIEIKALESPLPTRFSVVKDSTYTTLYSGSLQGRGSFDEDDLNDELLKDYDAEIAYYEGVDNKLDKVVIIGEGFDFTGTTGPETLYGEWENGTNGEGNGRVSELLEHGYDVFFISYRHHNRALQTNAQALKTLIKEINKEKYRNYEGIYIGESTSGLLGRIALKELENEGYDHQMGLFISYDSPQRGANIPEGVQTLLHDLVTGLPVLLVFSYVTEFFEGLFGKDMPYLDMLHQLNSPAAMQMIATHYTFAGNLHHQDLMVYFDDLGYPNQCRNVAWVNGSDNATRSLDNDGESYAPGSSILSLAQTFKIGLSLTYTGAWYTKANANAQIVSSIWGFLSPIPQVSVISSGPLEWSTQPGSYVVQNNIPFTFVPTVSAIDLDRSLFEDGNFNYVNKNKAQIIADGLTPFDDFYANEANFEHTTYEDFYDIMNQQEYMYDSLFVQNKVLNKNRDFEAQHTLTAGKDVQPDGFTSRPSQSSSLNKQIQKEPVVVKDGATVTFVAGEEITFKAGFEVKDGSHLHAWIQNKPHESRSEAKVYAPVLKGSGRVCGTNTYYSNTNASWHLRGEGIDDFGYGETYTTPEGLAKGQYTLYAEYLGVSRSQVLQVTTDERCEVLKQLGLVEEDVSSSVSRTEVFPNPTKDKIVVQTPHNIIAYSIVNTLGQNLLEATNVNQTQLELNLSDLANGIYYIQLNTEQGYEQHKIIKQ